MKISVIFSTYNSPKWLEKVLWGFINQTDSHYEIVVADDGSSDATRELVARYQAESAVDIKHVWHPDEGFRKCQILNKAIVACEGDYIVMTDGDCIPRRDFLAVHRAYAEPGYFLSGGYFKLPMSASEAITRDDVLSGHAFNTSWLIAHGLKSSLKCMKLTAGPVAAKIFNTLTLTKPTWNGHNASCFKAEALRVNGFDERMRYGGLDVEFGGRLLNAGVKTKQIRYSAICVHLDHARGYVNDEDWKNNRKVRNASKHTGLIETPAGIKQSCL